MDDGMLGGAMTLEGIGKQLTDIQRGLSDVQSEVGGLRTEVRGIRTDIAEIRTDVAVLKTDVAVLKTDLAALDHKTTVQFEETRRMLRFGLEAREALRETMERSFGEADHKHDEQIALLHDVLRHAGGEARP